MSIDCSERASLTRVGLTYGLAQGTGVRALEQVDLTLIAGRLTALVGPNGSGKSSIMALLAGRIEPQEGQVVVAGQASPARLRGRARRALHASVSFVSQVPELDPEMCVAETLLLLATLHAVPRSERNARVTDCLENMGLSEHRRKRVDELSGGLRRRLHLAGALIHVPQLLLLDEPGAGLDDESTTALWTTLASLAAAGTAILVITHDLVSVEAHADEVLLMDAGQVVQRGTPAQVSADHVDLVAALRARIGTAAPVESRGGRGRAGRGRGRA
ncbi:MAG: ABC-type multidrug transport system ATPase subunit [Chlamydiales bacterium]|jgi:ABC-type multidrug transport system ATPase subunit